MNLQQTPCVVNKFIPFSNTVKCFLKNIDQEDDDNNTNEEIRGGVLGNKFTWLSNGPRLEILLAHSGIKYAAWTFGAVLRDLQTYVSCVAELPVANGRPPLVVVGLGCELTGGMICVFDITSSRVLRAIQIDECVTSICVVNDGTEPLPGTFQSLDGVLIVGTTKGKILLIDLCREAIDEAFANNSEYIKDEVNSCVLTFLTSQDLSMLEHHKEVSVKTGSHLCLQLNENCTSGAHFTLKGPRGEDRIHAAKNEVAISALYYCKQLGSLLVGYNFGAFQIYNLLSVILEYTSSVYENCVPVSHFAIQEPCDDPRAFCYIWAVYGRTEPDEPGIPVAVMYALAYGNKEHLEGYGALYQDLISCSVRFQTELGALPGSKIRNPVGAQCITLRSHSKGIVNKFVSSIQDIHEDSLALCMVAWNVWDSSCNETYLSLFDLNQWYKEQMPSTPRPGDSSSYIVFVPLTELFTPVTHFNSQLLDVKIDPSSINQFVCVQRLEEHYYPNALSFKFVCVREEDVIWASTPGVQRHLLNLIKTSGPLCMLRPTETFQQCIKLGLIPQFMEVPANPSLSVQRELVLSVALEHQMIVWLCQCAQDWANGSQSSGGCTLDFLLSWAWHRASVLKFNANKLCVPLFDYSASRLDTNAHQLLNHCACQLKHLSTLYKFVVDNCLKFLSNEDVTEICQQWRALQMISVYLEVSQWLLNIGLLPECPLSMYPRPDESERISAPYPAETLSRFYQERRIKLSQKSKNSTSLLFIDNLVDLECGGHKLRQQWKEDGGSGLYPPPSLQALLRTYLIEDIDIVHKHCVFIYLFLDLAMTLDQSRYKPIITHLIKFPAVFKLSPSLIKITQAFWQLDHGDFSTAMSQLLDPLVNTEDLQLWHHRVALQSLLAQGQCQHAMLYHEVRKPPMTETRDLRIIIILLVVNDLLQEAFNFQRQNRSESNELELLEQFFDICKKTDKLSFILHLPLCSVEEEAFVKYLREHPGEDMDDFLVLYYLHRSRYGEAFQVNDLLNNKIHFGKQGLVGMQERKMRDSIVGAVQHNLPTVMQSMIDHCKNRKNNIWRKVDRPIPLSVSIHDNNENTKYKSTLIEASLLKARETWMHLNKNNQYTLDEIPFISTPKAIPTEKRTATPVIYPTTIHLEKEIESIDELDEATPAKQMRISSRRSISSDSYKPKDKKLTCMDSSTMLEMPVIKRKLHLSKSTDYTPSLTTPTSILKVRSLVRNSVSPIFERSYSTTPDKLENLESDNDQPLDSVTEECLKNVVLSLSQSKNKSRILPYISPRKSIHRTPKPVVRFDDKLSRQSDASLENLAQNTTSISSSHESSPKQYNEEAFYSTNTSPTPGKSANIPEPKEPAPATPKRSVKRKSNGSSVQSRRSYKNADETIVQEVQSLKNQTNISTPNLNQSNVLFPNSSVSIPNFVPKLEGRRSLSRQVLVHNSLSKAFSSPRMQTRLSLSKMTPDKTKTVGLQTCYSEKSKTSVKVCIENQTEETSNTSTIETENYFSTETNPETSEQIIKLVHNEKCSKSSSKTIEILKSDSDSEETCKPLLSNDSIVDESFLERLEKKKSQIVYESMDTSSIDLDHDISVQENVIDPNLNDSMFTELKPMEVTRNSSSVYHEQLELTDDLSTNEETGENIIEVEADVHFTQNDSQEYNEDVLSIHLGEAYNLDTTDEINVEQFSENIDSVIDTSKEFTENLDTKNEENVIDIEEESVSDRQNVSEDESMSPLKLTSRSGSEVEKISDEESVSSFMLIEEPNLGDLPSSDEDQIHEEYEEVDLEAEEDTSDDEKMSDEDKMTDEDKMSDVEKVSDTKQLGNSSDVDKVSNIESSSDVEKLSDVDDVSNHSNIIKIMSSESEQEVEKEVEENSSDLDESSPEYEEHISEYNTAELNETEKEENQMEMAIASILPEEEEVNVPVMEVSDEENLQDPTETEFFEPISVNEMNVLEDEIFDPQMMEENISHINESSENKSEACEENISPLQEPSVINEPEIFQENLLPVDESREINKSEAYEENISSLQEPSVINEPEAIQENLLVVHESSEINKFKACEENISQDPNKPERHEKNILDKSANELTDETETVIENVSQSTKKTLSSETLKDGCSQDCLEKTLTSQDMGREELYKTDILADIELDTTQTKTTDQDDDVSEASIVLYVPKEQSTRSSSRLSQRSDRSNQSSLSHLDEDKYVEDSQIQTRKRSASVDVDIERTKKRFTEKQMDTLKRVTRSSSIASSVSEYDQSETRSIRASLVVNMPIVKSKRRTRSSSVDVPQVTKRTGRGSIASESIVEESESSELIANYSATHRLTRSQKMIMERNMEQANRRKSVVEAHINPMKLFDELSFTGSPDRDEHQRDISPTSSVTTQSSICTRSSTRLAQERLKSPQKLDNSSESYSESRPRRKSFTLAKQAFDTPKRKYTRRQSETSLDNVSVTSETSSPKVLTEKLDEKKIRELGTRHRSLSPTLLKAIGSASPRTKRKGRQSILPKIDLSNIVEENSNMENKSASSSRVKNSARKSDEEKNPGDLPNIQNVPSRHISYQARSLDPYLPKYLPERKRKTMSLKRWLRKE